MNDDQHTAPTGAIASQVSQVTVHQSPRISANKLAEYVTADPSRQKAILRDSKYVKSFLVVPYKQTRATVKTAFSPTCLDINKLVVRANALEQQNEAADLSPWSKSDNINSAAALRHLSEVAPELTWPNANLLPIKFSALVFAGVKVSISPEVVFSFEHNGVKKLGAVILNTAKSDDKALDRNNGHYCVGDYLSSLVFQMLVQEGSRFGVPLNKKCFAVDVFRNKVYTAPPSYVKLNKNVEAACEMIASCWGSIKPSA